MIFLRVRLYFAQFASSFSFFLEVVSIRQSKEKIRVHGIDIEEPNSCNMYSLDFVDQQHLAFSSVWLAQTNYYGLIPFDLDSQ